MKSVVFLGLSNAFSIDHNIGKKYFSRNNSMRNSTIRSRRTSASALISKRRSTKNSDYKDDLESSFYLI